jgi:hypothetical protein
MQTLLQQPDEPTTHISVLGPDRIDILESSVNVALSTGDESSIVVSLRPQQLQSLVGLGSGLLELLGGRVEVGFRGGVGLNGLVNSLSAWRKKSKFSTLAECQANVQRFNPKLTEYL